MLIDNFQKKQKNRKFPPRSQYVSQHTISRHTKKHRRTLQNIYRILSNTKKEGGLQTNKEWHQNSR